MDNQYIMPHDPHMHADPQQVTAGRTTEECHKHADSERDDFTKEGDDSRMSSKCQNSECTATDEVENDFDPNVHLREHTGGHRKMLEAFITYFEDGIITSEEEPDYGWAMNYLAHFHPVQYRPVKPTLDRVIAEACRAALAEEWAQPTVG